MRKSWKNGTRLLALAAAAFAVLACGESPSEPEDGINPGLLEGGDPLGLSSGEVATLPQGAATFTGPDGLPMDATAYEFIQRVTTPEGTVLRTSGISVRAVPDEAVQNPPIHRAYFGSAVTGSLESVSPGTYAIDPVWPEINFIDEIPVTYASVQEHLGTRSVDHPRANGGTFTITSVNYFDDVYPCELTGDVFTVELCEYQLGLLQGVIEFTVTLEDGTEMVQEQTDFALPVQRKTIVAQINR